MKGNGGSSSPRFSKVSATVAKVNEAKENLVARLRTVEPKISRTNKLISTSVK